MPGREECSGSLPQARKLPSLANLEGSFMGLSGNQAVFAYLISLSSVRYMIDSFGLYRVKSVLDELGAGADTGKAISSVFYVRTRTSNADGCSRWNDR